MSEELSAKKYPVTTSEVAKMLGLKSPSEDLPMGSFVPQHNLPAVNSATPITAPSGVERISNLPVAESPAPHQAGDVGDAGAPHSDNMFISDGKTKSNSQVWLKIGKAAAPYAVVFAVGLFLYYFFFTGVNFGDLFKAVPKPVTPKETALQSLESQNLSGYTAWINGFYYDVSDPKIIDPETDNSGNGLSNFQKYLLNLNPKTYDTLGTGRPDSQTLSEGINPLTGSPLTDAQKAVLDKYIDMEVVMNRLTLSNMQAQPSVAGANVTANSGASTQILNTFPTAGNQPNYNPTAGSGNQTGSSVRGPAPVTGANLASAGDIGADINTGIPGRLEIPDLKINVPIMWSKTVNDFDKDLQSGVVHYPGTALPGEIGTTYIAGHSSNYPWAKGIYNRVFSTLGNLADNTSFKITVVSKGGKDVIYNYVVIRRQEYSPTDQAQFANSGDSVVALSTCWPVNSTAKRLVVFGKLTQVVK